jgi:hypothetical protein
MKQIIEIQSISDFTVKPGTTKTFFCGKINNATEQLMLSSAVEAKIKSLAKKPQEAAKFLLEECQIQVSEFGRMICLSPKLGKAMFSFSGTLHK